MAPFAIPTRMRMALSGTPVARWYAQGHRRLYRWSRGRLGRRVHAPTKQPQPPVLLLSTIGRRSGRTRTTPLIYDWEPSRLVVLAANAGHPRDPDWFLNLRTDRTVRVQIGRDLFDAEAELIRDATERDRLWRRFAATVYPAIDDYARQTTRAIPVVVLRRGDGADWPPPHR